MRRIVAIVGCDRGRRAPADELHSRALWGVRLNDDGSVDYVICTMGGFSVDVDYVLPDGDNDVARMVRPGSRGATPSRPGHPIWRGSSGLVADSPALTPPDGWDYRRVRTRLRAAGRTRRRRVDLAELRRALGSRRTLCPPSTATATRSSSTAPDAGSRDPPRGRRSTWHCPSLAAVLAHPSQSPQPVERPGRTQILGRRQLVPRGAGIRRRDRPWWPPTTSSGGPTYFAVLLSGPLGLIPTAFNVIVLPQFFPGASWDLVGYLPVLTVFLAGAGGLGIARPARGPTPRAAGRPRYATVRVDARNAKGRAPEGTRPLA